MSEELVIPTDRRFLAYTRSHGWQIVDPGPGWRTRRGSYFHPDSDRYADVIGRVPGTERQIHRRKILAIAELPPVPELGL